MGEVTNPTIHLEEVDNKGSNPLMDHNHTEIRGINRGHHIGVVDDYPMGALHHPNPGTKDIPPNTEMIPKGANHITPRNHKEQDMIGPHRTSMEYLCIIAISRWRMLDNNI